MFVFQKIYCSWSSSHVEDNSSILNGVFGLTFEGSFSMNPQGDKNSVLEVKQNKLCHSNVSSFIVCDPLFLVLCRSIDSYLHFLTLMVQILHSKLNADPDAGIECAILYDGSITVFDSRLCGFDIGTCLEVMPSPSKS